MSRRPENDPAVLSMAAATLAVGTSLAGVLVPETYAREAPPWAVQAIGQDVANLVVASVLFTCALAWTTGSRRAQLVCLGCLLYFLYAFAIYAFALHFSRLFLAYVAVLGFSFFALAVALARLDLAAVTAPLRDHPHRRAAGILLIAIGAVFGPLWLAEIVPHVLAGTTPSALVETGLLTNPVHVLDLAILLPAMILVGALSRRKNPWGLLFAVPLLIFAMTMGIAILCVFAISASSQMPVSVPAAIVIGAIVVCSGTYAWLLLRRTSAAS
jgi:hypothetical protein